MGETTENSSSVDDVLGLAAVAGEAIGRFIPLIDIATSLIHEIIKIYETAEYNRNICDALVERVKLSSNAIDSLKRRKKKNESKFRDDEYYKAFNRFIYVLQEIKKFAADISNIHGFKKYTKAIYVRDKFHKLTKDYDVAMKDLHFTMAVANEEQRKVDAEALEDDLAEMSKYLEKIQNDILEGKDKIDIIHDVVMHMMNHLDDKPLHDVHVNKIDSKDVSNPSRGKSDDKRGTVVRRIYKGQEIACKSILKTEDEMKTCSKTQRLFEILMKLSESKHILRFYGISKIENDNVMIFEWAERGNLRQVYEQKNIKWHYKVRIALEICRGLIFLQRADILHHDLKCQNILMTESLEPKIYNFELARFTSGNTTSLNDQMMKDAVSWLAPEKLIDYKSRYTTQCEIFSFGMLLWELAFEKIPYKGWKVEKIKEYVIKGGRERIVFDDSTPTQHQEDYKEIINDSKYFVYMH